MQIQKLTASPYRLPFKQPWTDHHGQHTERRGWIIKIETENAIGMGECAPFPSAGTESLGQAESWLQTQLARFKGMKLEDLLPQLDHDKSIPPATHCGIETAIVDLLSQQTKQSLSQWLNPNSENRVLVNANLGVLGKDSASKLGQYDDYKVIKLKVGLGNLESEIRQLRALCPQMPPTMTLRLDANQAWNLDDAARFLEACKYLPIDCIEEPIQSPTAERLQTLQASTQIPIAADESLAEIPLDELLHQAVVKRLVLKPMAHSGPRRCLELSKRAYENGMDVIVTTTIDSAIGVRMSSHLAAALGSSGQKTAHGLDTSRWLARDLADPPSIQNGAISLRR